MTYFSGPGSLIFRGKVGGYTQLISILVRGGPLREQGADMREVLQLIGS